SVQSSGGNTYGDLIGQAALGHALGVGDTEGGGEPELSLTGGLAGGPPLGRAVRELARARGVDLGGLHGLLHGALRAVPEPSAGDLALGRDVADLDQTRLQVGRVLALIGGPEEHQLITTVQEPDPAPGMEPVGGRGLEEVDVDRNSTRLNF